MASTTDRRPWNLQTIAREYHRRKNYASYTMVWHKTIEADIKDPDLTLHVRLLIAIRHYAWGNFSDWAVEGPPSKEPGTAPPKPMKNKKLAEILNTSESQISKACSYWKQRGQLRKDHQFLFPEDCISPSDSVNDSGVSFYSGKLDSPYLRFEESYLTENKQLRESITGIEAERKTFKAKLRESSQKLNKAKLPILSAWRDYLKQQEEQQTQENQQEEPDDQNEPESTRLCARAQNENDVLGESEANKSFLSANQYSFGVVSNSPQNDFPTPGMALSESDLPLVSKPNKNRNGASGALKSLNSLKGKPQDVKTTTTVEASVKSSSSSPSSLAVPDEWRDGLAGIFTRAHKPAPLPAQTGAAYSEIAGDWKAFLKWLPESPQFKRTHHPGGLPSLIQFFIADRQPAPAVADPETLTKEEIENYWKSRFEQNPAERKDIACMFPELFKSEVA